MALAALNEPGVPAAAVPLGVVLGEHRFGLGSVFGGVGEQGSERFGKLSGRRHFAQGSLRKGGRAWR